MVSARMMSLMPPHHGEDWVQDLGFNALGFRGVELLKPKQRPTLWSLIPHNGESSGKDNET